MLGASIYEVDWLERGGKIGLNRSLYTHFPSFHSIFLFAPRQLGSHKKLFLGRNTAGGHLPSHSPPTYVFGLKVEINLSVSMPGRYVRVGVTAALS